VLGSGAGGALRFGAGRNRGGGRCRFFGLLKIARLVLPLSVQFSLDLNLECEEERGETLAFRVGVLHGPSDREFRDAYNTLAPVPSSQLVYLCRLGSAEAGCVVQCVASRTREPGMHKVTMHREIVPPMSIFVTPRSAAGHALPLKWITLYPLSTISVESVRGRSASVIVTSGILHRVVSKATCPTSSM